MLMRKTETSMRYKVLIDTWWNVNVMSQAYSAEKIPVLIDTWWNVNKVIAALVVSLPGFNRYMVECECQILYV